MRVMRSMTILMMVGWGMMLTAADTPISVGEVSVKIPSPQGFSPVTEEMTVLYELQKQFVAPSNKEFLAFIPDADVPAVLNDEIPDFARRFTVQTAKNLINTSVSTSYFQKFKNLVKTKNNELMREVEKELSGVIEGINKGVSEKYDVDLAFSVSQMVPLPVHEETERTLAYSMMVKYNMMDENGKPAPFVIATTLTFVHIKSKVLFLYCYAEESALEWSRSASRQWANAVVSANPSDLKTSLKESLPSTVSGIDWRRVGMKAVSGALIGLIVGLIFWVINHRKSS